MGRPGRSTLLPTGAAEGLGASIAGTFAAAGYDVVDLARTGRSSAHLNKRVEQSGGTCAHLTCDITQPVEVAAALQTHAAGIYRAGTWIGNPARFRRSLESNAEATYWVKRGHLRPLS